MDPVLYALLKKIAESGASADVTPAAVAAAIERMSQAQLIQVLEAIGAEPAPEVEIVTGTTATISANADTIYKCGELTALTIETFPQTGSFSVEFTSGSTATVFTEPSGMVMPDGFSVEANKRYEINVSDGYAVVASWEVSV